MSSTKKEIQDGIDYHQKKIAQDLEKIESIKMMIDIRNERIAELRKQKDGSTS